ncbi:MAG: histidine phosphatase family protein [Desulfobacterales bacterium]|nr:histidine phosphatase family protein [Desulfobacterales bacterium]
MNDIRKTSKGTTPTRAQAPADTRHIKTLCLIRHAKSSWKYPGLADADRPLGTRGRHEAALMGRVLSERGFAPDRWFSSPALRALRTAEALAGAVGWPVSGIALEQRLYEHSSEELLVFLQTMDDHAAWVACVGHNPELTDLACRLASKNIANVPTCGVVEMRFALQRWQVLGDSEPISVSYDFPKNHL